MNIILVFFFNGIIVLFTLLYWNYWKLRKTYKNFPSVHLDIYPVFKLLTGRIAKGKTLGSYFLQQAFEGCKRHQEEGICVIWFFFRPIVIIFNEEYTKALSRETAAISKTPSYKVADPIMQRSLALKEATTWKKHRRFVIPAFQLSVLKEKMHIYNNGSADLVKKIKEMEGISTSDMDDVISYYNVKILLESLMGVKTTEEKDKLKILKYKDILNKIGEDWMYRLTYPWLLISFLWSLTSRGKNHSKMCNEIHAFTKNAINEIKQSIVSCKQPQTESTIRSVNKKSVAEVILEEQLKNSEEFTTEDVEDEITSSLLAAFNATPQTVKWCLYLLSEHPDVQEKAFEEVISVVNGKDVSYDDLRELKYLEKIIQETLRLFPVIPIYGRKASRNINIGKYEVPRGCELYFCPYLLHRNPYVYPDPEIFEPNRFSETRQISNNIAFARGIRNCPGEKFAMMELKVMLVHILREFEIKALDKVEENDLEMTVTLKPVKPIRFMFSLRRIHS